MFKTVLPLVLLCTLLLSSVRGSPASLSSLPLHARATNTSNNLSNVDGSKVFKDCVQRYNTSRMKPLPQQGYHNPNITNGSMITVGCFAPSFRPTWFGQVGLREPRISWSDRSLS